MRISCADGAVTACRWAVVFSLVLVMSGCSDGAPPPLEDLPLRDTLQASPVVVASLPRESIDRLNERAHAARIEDDAPVIVAGAPAGSALDGARVVDHARRAAGSDALFAYTLADAATEVHAVRLAVPEPSTGHARIELEGERDDATARLEDLALAGPVRFELAALEAKGVRHFVRVKGWPVAILVRGDTAYVNASWLVLEALEQPRTTAALAAPAEGSRATEAHVTAAPPSVASASPDRFQATGDSVGARGAGSDGICDRGCQCNDKCPCSPAQGGGAAGPSRDSNLLAFAPLAYLCVRARRARRDR